MDVGRSHQGKHLETRLDAAAVLVCERTLQARVSANSKKWARKHPLSKKGAVVQEIGESGRIQCSRFCCRGSVLLFPNSMRNTLDSRHAEYA
eukprot:6180852-Pleurochrysis_carterae.AAC.2